MLSDYWLFADFKRMLVGSRFSSNEEAIAEVEAYFESCFTKNIVVFKLNVKIVMKILHYRLFESWNFLKSYAFVVNVRTRP